MKQEASRSVTQGLIWFAMGRASLEQISAATGAPMARVVKMAGGRKSLRVDEASAMAQLVGLTLCELVARSRMAVGMAIPS
jgi:hypothetical protein